MSMIHIHDNRVIEDQTKISRYFCRHATVVGADKKTRWEGNFLTRKTRDARQGHQFIHTTVASKKIFLGFPWIRDFELELLLFPPCRNNVFEGLRSACRHFAS